MVVSCGELHFVEKCLVYDVGLCLKKECIGLQNVLFHVSFLYIYSYSESLYRIVN